MMNRNIFSRLLLIAVMLWAFASCHQHIDPNAPIRMAGQAQGTYYSIIYYDSLQRNLQGEIDSILRDFDLVASLWVEESEINRVNNCKDTIAVSDMFADIYQKAESITDLTNGRFDCRIGPLVKAYGFANEQRRKLTEDELEELTVLCGMPTWLDTIKGRIIFYKTMPKQALDFNAIAQGYSVDLVCQYFESMNIHNYLVDIGGEVRTNGRKPDGQCWHVGVEHPAADSNDARSVEVAIAMGSESLVTSGNYRKYYEDNGVRFSHTIDPFTSKPVEHTTLSASVIDSTSWRADALATAFMVMGVERAKKWLKKHPEVQYVYFIYDSAGCYAHYATPAFQQRINVDNLPTEK